MTDTDDDGGRSTGAIIALVIGGLLILAVVGVVAIVVLSAVIGGFVLGTGSSVSTPPEVEFTSSFADGSMTITHDGGESVDPTQLLIVVDGTERGTWRQMAETSDSIQLGDSVTVDAVDPGEEVRVVFVDEDTSVPIFAREAPEGDASAALAGGAGHTVAADGTPGASVGASA